MMTAMCARWSASWSSRIVSCRTDVAVVAVVLVVAVLVVDINDIEEEENGPRGFFSHKNDDDDKVVKCVGGFVSSVPVVRSETSWESSSRTGQRRR